MYQSIVVPLDGSCFSEAALPLATRIARSAHARLHLVLSHQPTAALVGGGEVAVPTDQLDATLREREQIYLDATAERLGRSGFQGVEALHAEGSPGPAVCEEIHRMNADLVVMATHGRGALGRLWLGSVAEYVIRHAGVPVVLVRPGQSDTALPSPAGGGILMAVDLSPHSDAMLAPTVAMACLLHCHITLLHVVVPAASRKEPSPAVSPGGSPSAGEMRAEAQRRLDQMADRLRERGCSVSTRVATNASAAAGILNELEGGRFDLVAVSTRGMSGMRRLFIGSSANRVIRAANTPVLVIDSGGTGAKER